MSVHLFPMEETDINFRRGDGSTVAPTVLLAICGRLMMQNRQEAEVGCVLAPAERL